MATFTMTLSEIRHKNPYETFGLDSYPIFDESYREVLNSKIVDRYWTQEIGIETLSRFRKFMRSRMNEIMPMYNQLYKSQKLIIDPLNTVSIKTLVNSLSETDEIANSESEATANTESESNSTGNASQDNTTDSSGKTVDMLTPQNELARNGDYATGGQQSIAQTKVDGSSTNSENTNQEMSGANTAKTSDVRDSQTKDTRDSETKGYTGNQSEMLNLYRSTFLNVDLEIIEELSDLFMQVWSNGNEFYRTESPYVYHTLFPYFR